MRFRFLLPSPPGLPAPFPCSGTGLDVGTPPSACLRSSSKVQLTAAPCPPASPPCRPHSARSPLYPLAPGCRLRGQALAGRLGTTVRPSSRSQEPGLLPRPPSFQQRGSGEGALPSLLRRRGPTDGQQGLTPAPAPAAPPHPAPPSRGESRSPSEQKQEKNCPARRSFLLSRLLLKGGGEPGMRGRGLETQLFLLNRLFLK